MSAPFGVNEWVNGCSFWSEWVLLLEWMSEWVNGWVNRSVGKWGKRKMGRSRNPQNQTPPIFALLWSFGLFQHFNFLLLPDTLITNLSRWNFALTLYSFDVYNPPNVCEPHFSHISYKNNVFWVRTHYKCLIKFCTAAEILINFNDKFLSWKSRTPFLKDCRSQW